MKSIYIIGSLRNPEIVNLENDIEKIGIEPFGQWMAAGPIADDSWRDYAKARGWTYKQALNSYCAKHVFSFDAKHIERCDAAVLLMPAGRSGHLELGVVLGKGKPGFILFDQEPERWDQMVQFATEIFFSRSEFLNYLKSNKET